VYFTTTASGEWLLAYQAEQTKYLRAMFASVRSTFQRNMAVTKEQSIAEIPKFDNSPILDKAFIVSNISLLSDINAVISLNYLSSNTAM